MKLDEFAFMNQQLAGMLRAGIPLEGALRQTCETLHDGALRAELGLLEADLAQGSPLGQSLGRRKLPGFYARMLEIGAHSTDLPSLLTLLADYYQRLHVTWVRLKGLVFYPIVVLTVSFAVSLLIAAIFSQFSREMLSAFGEMGAGAVTSTARFVLHAGIWFPVALVGFVLGALSVILAVPRWREALRWRLPGFREARLSNLASSLALLLQNGCSAAPAIALVRQLEADSPAGAELARWQQRLAEGRTKFEELAEGGKVIPPLFVWLVAASRENWVEGFKHAADIYYERAIQRAEVLLYAVLPVSVLVLGCLIIGQLLPMARVFGTLTKSLVDISEVP